MSTVTLCEVRLPGSYPAPDTIIAAEWDKHDGYRVRQEGRPDVTYPSASAAVSAACGRATRVYYETR